jgi:CheY-like chemotaxis protein
MLMILSGDTLSSKGLVLLVDDEEVVLEVGTKMLEKIGYSVFKAKNGKEAVTIFKMPEMDGEYAYELLKEIKPDVKVLISSGSSLRDRTRQNLKYGCSGFIQKPFSIKALSQKVEELITQ